MTPRVSLALVLHNHQPVGNFGWVFEEVWEKAYLPMIAALERHPSVRVGLHYTGPLLDWLTAEKPDTIERIAALASRKQVELLGGGWYEPILAALTVADRHGQLVRMADEIERRFGQRPRGAWLAERVWEPSLAFDLAQAGYEYTIVDDNHLRNAAIPDERMWGTYIVDDQGRKLTVFATEQGLRYTIPWRPVPETIEHLQRHVTEDGRLLGTMGDDGEKFGAWPETFEHCWGRMGWVETFFEALERESGWLRTVQPATWLDSEPPLGRVAIPTSSYVEMTEWALPPDDALVFHRVLAEARERHDPSAAYLRGGTWRAFQSRYREINDLHKQMLRVSAKVRTMPPGEQRERALDHLYRGQSNDVYWHGLFGGVYLADLRVAALAELIAAEDLADGGRIPTELADHDLDGLDEVLLGGPGQSLLVDLAEGAGVGAWDLLATRVPLMSVMRRRPEATHVQLTAAAGATTIATAPAAPASMPGDPVGPTSPHAALVVKESGLERLLTYDRHERRGGLVRLLGTGESEAMGPEELALDRFVECADTVDAPFDVVELSDDRLVARRHATLVTAGERVPVTITKGLLLGGERLTPSLEAWVEIHAPEAPPTRVELDIEWPFNMLGGGGNPQAWYSVPVAPGGPEGRSQHDGRGDARGVERSRFGNDHLGVEVTASLTPAGRVTWYPIETVSSSEGGFERIYQGSSLHLRWPVTLGEGVARVAVCFEIHQTHDRGAIAG
ncbi:MAG: DUF1925 domain-containing protein [Chloroflexi bacterium]|nr:DUF1925 domain-containing protein [Chloroflexota bacterium]HEV8053671.1 alpha-amylase/4-alpha-glucanotransferase domain-containing protein [Candidatus Limnocylindrales bacterium]